LMSIVDSSCNVNLMSKYQSTAEAVKMSCLLLQQEQK